MVHALKEAWRVLKPHGTLVDVRPICGNFPLEIMTPAGYQSAGMIDGNPGKDLDIAANRAIRSVVLDRYFKRSRLEYFDFAYIWGTIKLMKKHFDEKWKGDIILHDEVMKQARDLYAKNRKFHRIRVRIRMKLVKYEKR